MSKRKFDVISLFALALSLGSASACNGAPDSNPGSNAPFKILVAPTDEATRAANDFKSDFPAARIFFSQNTGDLLWLDGNGTPLAQGALDTAEHALDAIRSLMKKYPGLYRITDPDQALAVKAGDLTRIGNDRGVISLHFEELQNGVPLRGHYGVAIFDSSGKLLSLQTRLLVSAAFEADPATNGQAAPMSRVLSPQHTSRRVWDRLEGETRYRILEEHEERSGIQVLRTWRDPRTGAVVKSIDETPSDLVAAPKGWATQTPVLAAARDTLGAELQIPSTQAPGILVLGFHLAGIHAPGMAVSIGDAGASKDPSIVPLTPLASNAQDWIREAAYDSNLRAATTLASNLKTTLSWYRQNLNWSSWDNRGTTLFAGVRANRSGTSVPELNAWGGAGMLMIGDGLTPSGQPFSDALDIVAHEFTHSVIYATANMQYYDEAGALNESLADIFGKTVQGFPDVIEGSQAGIHLRDLAHPENCAAPDGHDCTQPGRYSEYRLLGTDVDNGGVHTNSGIVNKALTQVIQSPPALPASANGVTLRSIALAQLLLDSLSQTSLDSGLNLEEYAADLTAYCKAREQANTLQAAQAGYCQQLEASFMTAQLLTAPL